MGHYENTLDKMFSEPRWRAPKLAPLSQALEALERAVADLSQVDPDTWSGAAAEGAAETFEKLRGRYGHMKVAIRNVVEIVETANQVRDRVYTEFADLPSATVPSHVHQLVEATRSAGQSRVWISGKKYPVESAVYQYGQRLEQEREAKARELYEGLREELVPQRDKLAAARDEIEHIAERDSFDDEVPGPGGGGLPVPRGHIPSPRIGVPGRPKPPRVDDLYDIDDPRWEAPRERVPDEERRPDLDWPPRGRDPLPQPPPRVPNEPGPGGPGDPWERLPDGIPPTDGRYRGPNVDSGSAGTIGNPALNGGLLGGAGLAGGAALRWRSQSGTTGAPTGGSGSLSGTGGVGGAGGLGGAGLRGGLGATGVPGGAGGVIGGGRGLAGGLAGGGAGASGPGPGSHAGTGAGARGNMVSGGTPMGGRGGSDGDGDKKSGLGGHIAPKLEDDEDFMPQSDSARAGSRDDLQD